MDASKRLSVDGFTRRNGASRDVFFRRVGYSRALLSAAVLLIGALLWAGYHFLRLQQMSHELLKLTPDEAVRNPALVRFAAAQAKPLFASHCASCHGSDMKGRTEFGAPDLTDRTWLYGNGSVFDIERTLLFGIRSGASRARNVTEMPAFGQTGALRPAEIRDVVQYLLQLDGRPHLQESADRGRAIFNGNGTCFECHGGDARGDSDYGAPDLTANIWNNGGTTDDLYASLYFGRHDVCPAWLGTLDLEQIRTLAVYIYSASHP